MERVNAIGGIEIIQHDYDYRTGTEYLHNLTHDFIQSINLPKYIV